MRCLVSTFGWLDTDNEQRRKMLEVVDLFKEEGTVDELRIGSIEGDHSVVQSLCGLGLVGRGPL